MAATNVSASAIAIFFTGSTPIPVCSQYILKYDYPQLLMALHIACMLAKKGFTGPVRIIESDSGGIRQVIAQGDMDLERLMDFSGWRILDVRFKAMAANATTHGHVFATMAIVKEQNLKAYFEQSTIGSNFNNVKNTTRAGQSITFLYTLNRGAPLVLLTCYNSGGGRNQRTDRKIASFYYWHSSPID